MKNKNEQDQPKDKLIINEQDQERLTNVPVNDEKAGELLKDEDDIDEAVHKDKKGAKNIELEEADKDPEDGDSSMPEISDD